MQILNETVTRNTGLLSLLMLARFHGLKADAAKLQHEFGAEPFNLVTLLNAAKSIGFVAKPVRQQLERLNKAPLPCIAVDGEGRFFILAKVDEADARDAVAPPADDRTVDDSAAAGVKLLIQRPGEPPQILGLPAFQALWNGELIYMTSKASFASEVAAFDFTWFIPAIVKYRRLLGEVFSLSLVLQLMALVTPLFFQVVMDKVLVNHAMQTLHVIALGLLFATVFEVLLTGIRTYIVGPAKPRNLA